jgi:HKD family nuclease
MFIIGSSNFSLSAFKLGYEWNLAVSASAEPVTFQETLDQFMHLFHHENTEPLIIRPYTSPNPFSSQDQHSRQRWKH